MDSKYILKITILSILIAILFISCKKFLDIKSPNDQINSDKVFENDATAISAITGIYSEMMNTSSQFSNSTVTFYAGMAADELYYYTPDARTEFMKNNISVASHPTISGSFWGPTYKYIYITNLCLEKLTASISLTPSIKARLIGECKFVRAFCYFHLVNLFGNVPLSLTSDYRQNERLPRTAVHLIFEQIQKDLVDAKAVLSYDYQLPNRTVPNKWAASALLARVYLFEKNWVKAEQEATEVINSGEYSLLSNLNNVFTNLSNETIWQLAPVAPSRNTLEGFTILPASNSTVPTYLITPELLACFEPGDARKTEWIKSRVFSGQTCYYPYKYKIRTGTTINEYYVVLRLAELYLIRAEAKAQLNNTTGCINDLNEIRIRSGLAPLLTGIDQAHCLLAVEQERRAEFFAEWGNRWYDLKRTSRANAVLGNLKPTTWQPTDTLWPIPIDQIRLNSALTQNEGY
ncbi:MAG: RagB/SusD family nutrient uptake outer membrane protein [Ferruginibacter sp.]